MQGSFGEFYNVLFRFLRFAQVAERIKESRSKSGCYEEEDAAARVPSCVLKLGAPRVEFTFFNLYLLADVRGELATEALFLRRGKAIQNIVYRDAGNGNVSGINLVSRVIADVTD